MPKTPATPNNDPIEVTLTPAQAELLADLVAEAFDEADNDEDARDLNDLHMLLGYAPLVDEQSLDDEAQGE